MRQSFSSKRIRQHGRISLINKDPGFEKSGSLALKLLTPQGLEDASPILWGRLRFRSLEKNVINPDFHTPFRALHFGTEMLSAEILT